MYSNEAETYIEDMYGDFKLKTKFGLHDLYADITASLGLAHSPEGTAQRPVAIAALQTRAS